MGKHEFHAAAGIFPLMEDEVLQKLADDIRAHGLRESIKLHDGKIVDGRNRSTACLMAGVTPIYEQAPVNGSVADYVWSVNFHRRHLTDGGRQLAAGRYKEQVAKEQAAKRKAQAPGKPRGEKAVSGGKIATSEKGKARDDAGAKFNVSGKTVDAAAKVIKKGTPELVKAVERGEIKVSTAARLAEAPKVEQKKAVAGGKAAVRQAIEKHDPSPSEEARNDPGVIFHKSMQQIRMRLTCTREAGGVKSLCRGWSPELRKRYADEIGELIQEMQTWLNDLKSQ